MYVIVLIKLYQSCNFSFNYNYQFLFYLFKNFYYLIDITNFISIYRNSLSNNFRFVSILHDFYIIQIPVINNAQ